MGATEFPLLSERSEMPLPCPSCRAVIEFEAEIEDRGSGPPPSAQVVCGNCGCGGPCSLGSARGDFEGAKRKAIADWNRMPRRASPGPVAMAEPSPIVAESWLNEPRFTWFRDAYAHASRQPKALPALAAGSPEDLYFAVCAIIEAQGLPPPVGGCSAQPPPP
jgi:hypothetical protein